MCMWSNKPTHILINSNNYYYFIIIVVAPAVEVVLATTESCTSSLPAVAGVKRLVPEAGNQYCLSYFPSCISQAKMHARPSRVSCQTVSAHGHRVQQESTNCIPVSKAC